jgi:YVTN family beta-propeller protein
MLHRVGKLRRRRNVLVAAVVIAGWLVPAPLGLARPKPMPCAERAYAANSYMHNVSVIDTKTNQLVTAVPTGLAPYSPVISPEGSRVYVANSDSDTISVIDVATSGVVETLSPGANPSGLAFTPDGRQLLVTLLGATIFDPGSVRIITLATGEISDPIPVGRTPERLAVSPDGSRAYVINSDSALTVIDVGARKVVASIPMVGPAFSLVVSSDGRTVYGSLVNNDMVAIVDTATQTVQYVATDTGPIGISLTPDQRTLYVTNGDAGTIQEISLRTRKVTRTASAGLRPGYLQVSGDGRRGYITRSPGTSVAVYDLETLTEVASVITGWPTSIAVCGGT